MAYQRLGKETEEIGNQRNIRYHINHRIGKIGYNTEKTSGEQRILAVTQTFGKKLTRNEEISSLGIKYQKIGTGTKRAGNKKTSGEHPNYSIVEIG